MRGGVDGRDVRVGAVLLLLLETERSLRGRVQNGIPEGARALCGGSEGRGEDIHWGFWGGE